MGNTVSDKSSDASYETNPEDCLQYMMKGSHVLKVNVSSKKKSKKKQRRFLTLDEDKMAFRYEPSVKGKRFKIPISSIEDITCGKAITDPWFRKVKMHRKFLVTYTDDESETHKLGFISFTHDVSSIWTTGLCYLWECADKLKNAPDPLYQPWLKESFEMFDKDSNGALTFKEILPLLSYLDISSELEIVKSRFEQVNTEGDLSVKEGLLTKEEFAEFFKLCNTHDEIKDIFEKYNDGEPYWRLQTLQQFLSEKQFESVDKDTGKDIIDKFERSKELKAKSLISMEGLSDYLLSSDNELLLEEHVKVCQDMSKTLSHYYISSSHNTYLMEGQLHGASSVQAYINAFKQGCKCVELDCWDGDGGEPVIYHGRTLTTKVLFKDVIETVAEYAFRMSDYPVILSLENHCSCSQQEVMARHLKKILKDKLCIKPTDKEKQMLPSPKELMGKILVKGKKLPFDIESADVVDDGTGAAEDFGFVTDDENDYDDAIDQIFTDIDPRQKFEISESDFQVSEKNGCCSEDGTSHNRSGNDDVHGGSESPGSLNQNENSTLTASSETLSVKKPEKKSKSKKKKKQKLVAELSLLVNYVQSVGFTSFEKALKDQAYFKMSSFGESKFTSLAKSSSIGFVDYNKKFLSRTYPSGTRMESSNYNPVSAWNVGCQIVALNFQTTGAMMDLVRGLFQLNGGCGYVLKPSFLRDENVKFNAEHDGKHANMNVMLITVTIISGQLLHNLSESMSARSKSITDPYVTLNVYGVPQDVVSKDKFKTKTVKNNGFNPIWNESFQFELHVSDLAFLRFAVYDDDFGVDDFLLQYTIPFKVMRPGYRRMKLLTEEGEEAPYSSLLIHTDITVIQ